jgi:hypothetical protein
MVSCLLYLVQKHLLTDLLVLSILEVQADCQILYSDPVLWRAHWTSWTAREAFGLADLTNRSEQQAQDPLEIVQASHR